MNERGISERFWCAGSAPRCEHGEEPPCAERQRYGDNLIDYIDRVRDPIRFEMEIPYDWEGLLCRDSGNFVTFLSPGNIILVISILVFASLGFVLIRLIKATGQEADEQK